VDQYGREKGNLFAVEHVAVVQQALEQFEDGVTDVVLLQVAGLLDAVALAGQDLLDHVLEHVHVRVCLVVVPDEQVGVPLLHVWHLVGGVDVLDQDVLGLAVEVDLLAEVDEFDFELEVGVQFEDGGDFVYLPLPFGQLDAVLERAVAERGQEVDLRQEVGVVLREHFGVGRGVGREDEVRVELDLAAQFFRHHLQFLVFDHHVHPDHAYAFHLVDLFEEQVHNRLLLQDHRVFLAVAHGGEYVELAFVHGVVDELVHDLFDFLVLDFVEDIDVVGVHDGEHRFGFEQITQRGQGGSRVE